MNDYNIADRMQAVIDTHIPEGRRFKALEEISGIAAVSWRKAYLRGQRPTADMLEALSKAWPQYAFWLVTGITDPDYGHVSPASTGTYTVVKGREQPHSTQEFLFLIDRRRHEPVEDEDRAQSRREIEDEVFELRKKSLIPATYFNYEQAMRGYDESGRGDFYLIETDEELQRIRQARRIEIKQAEESALQWRQNVAKNKKAEQFIRKLVSKVWR
ncbi:hypothetical protein [Paraburkholderia fungorum]|uniref:hypothetical protein n=1 Tax=Paraburkholderia fungorum TaxID=134537 RepID=UPI001C1EC121|nr:hypothetical protein [Paraburkholderia fungorum]MBU7437010.1 hypothetical protein [Paraburkholderia fungorum]